AAVRLRLPGSPPVGPAEAIARSRIDGFSGRPWGRTIAAAATPAALERRAPVSGSGSIDRGTGTRAAPPAGANRSGPGPGDEVGPAARTRLGRVGTPVPDRVAGPASGTGSIGLIRVGVAARSAARRKVGSRSPDGGSSCHRRSPGPPVAGPAASRE